MLSRDAREYLSLVSVVVVDGIWRRTPANIHSPLDAATDEPCTMHTLRFAVRACVRLARHR